MRIIVVAVLVLLAAAGTWLTRHHHATSNGRLQVTASFYPLAEFARQVGGDNVSVTTLVQPGVEPHDYDPTPRDVAAMYTSKVFIYNGAGLETWIPRLQAELSQQGVIVVKASAGITYLAASGDEAGAEAGTATDPHVWMAPELAIQEVTAIRDAFMQADPAHRQTYEANATRYIKSLSSLDSDFRAGLAHCQSREIVTSHQAFRYLATAYNLQTLSIAGLSPDDEPSPQKLAQVADFVRQHHVRYIFFEALVSPKLSQTIAQETGAQTIAFNPLEGLTQQQIASGQTYVSVQQANLQALRTALHCQ